MLHQFLDHQADWQSENILAYGQAGGPSLVHLIRLVILMLKWMRLLFLLGRSVVNVCKVILLLIIG